MSFKAFSRQSRRGARIAVLSAALCAASAFAQDAGEEAQVKVDPALAGEIAYVEALIDAGLPDFAEPVIAETKKKWPESEAAFFAIEIRGMLLLGKFDEANAKIASLPDRKSAKYWAARLEVANNFFSRGQREKCTGIYEEFFKNNQKPTKELAGFMRTARWQWGQILVGFKRYKEAADNYALLAKTIDPNASEQDASIRCNVMCEAAELYLRVASSASGKDRAPLLAAAGKMIDKLLWQQNFPVFFGRAIAMKAHQELLAGSVSRAQQTIDDYMEQLSDIHKQIEEVDPDGREGLLKQSPMPQCRYMLAEMLWNEAQAEFKKPNRDDERIKSLLFGERGKNGKRSGAGAYNHAINVFVKYPQSAWASQAGDLADAMSAFVEATYKTKIKTNISKADKERVRAMQFKGAFDKLGEKDFQGAIDGCFAALADYPEGRLSVQAVENIANAYLQLVFREKDAKKKESLRLDADAVEGYLSERFGGHPDKLVMTEAGDATLRLAEKEKSFGEMARSDALYEAFLANYRRHINAAPIAVTKAVALEKEKKFPDAARLYGLVARYYTNSTYYATALNRLAMCEEATGDRAAAIATMSKYVEAEKDALRSMQARMNLAMLYQKDGLEMLENAKTNATPEAADMQLAKGSAQIIRGIKQFRDFSAAAAAKLADPGVPAGEKEKYGALREGAMYLAGDCWGRLSKPEKNLEMFRRRCVEGLEEYVRQYPKGKYAKSAYGKLGVVYTMLNDVEKCKDALGRLRKEFPDSEEAKKAMPKLAKNLIEYAGTLADEAKRESLKGEATQIYSEMIRNESGDYQAIDFLRAGESLIDARAWALADEAFDKAIAKAGTNHMTTVAHARIGKAKSLFAQKNYSEARESLDLFMADEKMSKSLIATNACDLIIKVAMQQGSEERDATLRMNHYGAALGAIKKLRNYWSKEPLWKQDRAVFLMPADVKIAQIEVATALGQEEEAAKARGVAAANLQSFLQVRAPGPDNPVDKMSVEELANLDEAYSKLLPLLVKMGRSQAGRALKLGRQYLDSFPYGASRAEVQRAVNEAEALGAEVAEDGGAAAAPAAAPES